jgi:uncharacterized Zn-finger protein
VPFYSTLDTADTLGVAENMGGNHKSEEDEDSSKEESSLEVMDNQSEEKPKLEPLEEHQKDTGNGYSLTCKICERKFKTKYTLKSHEERVHSDNMPFKCSKCDQPFKDEGSCRRHEANNVLHRRLEKISSFLLCNICGKQFPRNRRWCLDQHLLTHLDKHFARDGHFANLVVKRTKVLKQLMMSSNVSLKPLRLSEEDKASMRNYMCERKQITEYLIKSINNDHTMAKRLNDHESPPTGPGRRGPSSTAELTVQPRASTSREGGPRTQVVFIAILTVTLPSRWRTPTSC